jgi:hypothetical protein
MVGLVAFVAILGCKRAAQEVDSGKNAQVVEPNNGSKGLSEPEGKVAGGTVEPTKGSKGPIEPEDYTRNFNALCSWCEQSVDEIDKANRSNPIRGKDLATSKLDFIRGELEGKTVHWRVKVNGIDPEGKVWVGSFHRVQREQANQQGRPKFDRFMLLVKLQKQQHFAGANFAADPVYSIKDVPVSKLRELSIGEFAPMVGTVTKVNYDNCFTIDLAGAKIE